MPKKYNPESLYEPIGPYVNVVEVGPGERLLFTAGIVGISPDGQLLEDPHDQISQAWSNVVTALRSAGMGPGDLVKLTTYLTAMEHYAASREAREKALGGPMNCAATGIIAQLFDPKLVIEIDVYAAR